MLEIRICIFLRLDNMTFCITILNRDREVSEMTETRTQQLYRSLIAIGLVVAISPALLVWWLASLVPDKEGMVEGT